MNITKSVTLSEEEIKVAIVNYITSKDVKLPKELIVDLEYFNGAQDVDMAYSKVRVTWEDTK